MSNMQASPRSLTLKRAILDCQLMGLNATDASSVSQNEDVGSLYKNEASHCLKHDSKQR